MTNHWRPIETAPKNEEAMFWIRPLTKAEAWCNTNGKPIFIDSPPELFVGKLGRWSSLWTATHWMPMPEGPSLETLDGAAAHHAEVPGRGTHPSWSAAETRTVPPIPPPPPMRIVTEGRLPKPPPEFCDCEISTKFMPDAHVCAVCGKQL